MKLGKVQCCSSPARPAPWQVQTFAEGSVLRLFQVRFSCLIELKPMIAHHVGSMPTTCLGLKRTSTYDQSWQYIFSEHLVISRHITYEYINNCLVSTICLYIYLYMYLCMYIILYESSLGPACVSALAALAEKPAMAIPGFSQQQWTVTSWFFTGWSMGHMY